MKFDVAIGNPPYNGKGHPLYLKIGKKVKEFSKKVIWLCPTQWVKCQTNKDYEFYKNHFKCEYYEDVGNPFPDADISNSLGVFVFGDKKLVDLNEITWSRFENPKLAKEIFEKIKRYAEKENLAKYNNCERNFNYYVNAGKIRGHVDKECKPRWDWTTLFGEEQRKNFNKFEKENWFHWNFKTKTECKNFIASTETDILMFALYVVKFNNDNTSGKVSEYIPYFGDYTKEWTEEMIQKELGLTDKEVEYIHKEMKDFGWKAK